MKKYIITEEQVKALGSLSMEWPFVKAILRSLPEVGEPVAHEFQARDGRWYPFIDQKHYRDTVDSLAWPIRALCTLDSDG